MRIQCNRSSPNCLIVDPDGIGVVRSDWVRLTKVLIKLTQCQLNTFLALIMIRAVRLSDKSFCVIQAISWVWSSNPARLLRRWIRRSVLLWVIELLKLVTLLVGPVGEMSSIGTRSGVSSKLGWLFRIVASSDSALMKGIDLSRLIAAVLCRSFDLSGSLD